MLAQFFVFCFSCFLTLGVCAQQLNEVDTLKRALGEFNAIQTLVDESINRTDRQGRFRFDYAALQQDLHLIKHGLRSAVYGAKIRPKRYRGLNGDYGEAGVVGEAEMLQMLMREIQALIPLLHEAQQQADSMMRLKVNYKALLGDLDTVISGIQQALAGSGGHPRSIPVLRGGFSHG